MGAVILLTLGVTTLFVRPRSVALWVAPFFLAVVGLAFAVIRRTGVYESLRLLRNLLLFLLFAVPLAVRLDRIGVFAALAAMVAGGRHLAAWLWGLAAVVTMVFNLDSAVVLSGLLRRDTAASLGVHVLARRYSAIGVRVGLPALLAAPVVVLLL